MDTLPPMSTPGSGKSVSRITSPKGTRDLYPEDALKRRYLEQSWRDASIRCGFEEIHGPTFETTDLYAVKSGEGILGELFQAYSGKAPEEVAQVQATGRAPYAMRPEFTPTLARMFAAKAGSLPKPCKWFTGGPYFRAERPQRGRLREFLQWNVDVIGLPGDLGGSGGGGNAEDAEDSAEVAKAKAWMDAECVECCAAAMTAFGLEQSLSPIHVNSRQSSEAMLASFGAKSKDTDRWLELLDRVKKIKEMDFYTEARRKKLGVSIAKDIFRQVSGNSGMHHFAVDTAGPNALIKFSKKITDLEFKISNDPQPFKYYTKLESLKETRDRADQLCWQAKIQFNWLEKWLESYRLQQWIRPDPSIVRGLAYYTGTVFEVLADGERAIAGGGRYDKLIELMGGPPTPAVGFAMGDVVVSLLLEDKGLMPRGAELMEAVSRRPASVRPEVFVVGADDESSDAQVSRLSADLRRGVEADAYVQAGQAKPWSAARYAPATGGVRPMHARVSYKSTRNLKKLLADGEKQSARLAAVVHGEDRVQLKDFDARRDLTPKDVGLSDTHAEFSADPVSPVYVGRAAATLLP